MKRAIFILIFASSSFAETLYVNQAGAGATDGSSLGNAFSAAQFNTSGNWGAGAGKISAGDTVILNATITSPLQIQAAGTAGNPITIQFATGAKMSKAHWNQGGSFQNAAIYNNGFSYIVIDGQTDGSGSPQGIIEATANGTALANQQFNHGIYFAPTTHDCVIKNLQISNLFVRTSGSASVTEDGIRGIRLEDSGGHNLITNNVIINVCHGIVVNHKNTSGSIDGDEIAYNTVEKRDAGIIYSSGDVGTSTGVLIHDNNIGDAVQWDDSADNFHHDGIHFYSGGALGHPVGLRYYNNYHYGDRGIHSTADIFLEDYWINFLIYNNLMVNSIPHQQANGDIGFSPSNGHITLKGRGNNQGSLIACNTIYAPNSGGHFYYFDACSGFTNELNLAIGKTDNSYIGTGILFSSSENDTSTSDYNLFYLVNQYYWGPTSTIYSTLAAWVSARSKDSHTLTTNPNLDGSYKPQSGSPALSSGQSFSAYFTVDRAGQTRPTGNWSVGAYELAGAGGGGGSSTPTQFSGAVTILGGVILR